MFSPVMVNVALPLASLGALAGLTLQKRGSLEALTVMPAAAPLEATTCTTSGAAATAPLEMIWLLPLSGLSVSVLGSGVALLQALSASGTSRNANRLYIGRLAKWLTLPAYSVMRAYHPDLRERIVHAHSNNVPHEEITSLFEISQRTLERYVKQHRETGSLQPRISTGRPRLLDAALNAALATQSDTHQDATLEQHRERLLVEQNMKVSASTVSRALRRLGRTRKKRRSTPASETHSFERSGEM